MRITLAQWKTYDLPIDEGNGTDEDACADCPGCRTSPDGVTVGSVSLCCYHEGFVDGFDAARGGG